MACAGRHPPVVAAVPPGRDVRRGGVDSVRRWHCARRRSRMAPAGRTGGVGHGDEMDFPGGRVVETACRRSLSGSAHRGILRFVPRRQAARVRNHAADDGRTVQHPRHFERLRFEKGTDPLMPHPMFVLLGVLLLSIAMAATEDRSPRERFYAAARVLLGWATVMVGGGWLMHWIHG